MLTISLDLDIDIFLIAALVCVSVAALAYMFLDVNYFLMSALIILWGMLFRKIKPDETTEFYGICTTHDLDIYYTHMNNARYVRTLDFARLHFYERTGLYNEILRRDGQPLLSATTIRYRKPITLFTFFKITTKMIFWDDNSIYLEHQFISLTDRFVRAVVLSKQTINEWNVNAMLIELLNKNKDYRPDLPAELRDWLGMMEKSSARLRKAD